MGIGTETVDFRAEVAAKDTALAAKDAALAAKDAALAAKDAQITDLTKQVTKLSDALTKLRERFEENSTNSNLPPSSDAPGRASGRKKKGGKLKRGGQKGHRGSHRQLLPPEEVDDFVDFFPPECESCWEPLEVVDPFAKRYQHTELHGSQPHLTEYCRHAVCCPKCGYKTKAKYEREVIPASAFGPRLMSVGAMLTGDYHLSRRKAVRLMGDVLGVRLSLGAVSRIESRVADAVEPAVVEAFEKVLGAEVKHTDGTSWYQAGVMLALWTIATAAATVFKILPNGREATLKLLFDDDEHGVLVSDRATALMFWNMKNRQICWTPLVRKFISFSERDGPAGRVGQELLDFTAIIFQYWNDYKSGKLSREEFIAWMAPVRVQFEAALHVAVAADIPRLSGSCKNLLTHQEALWTFVERQGVEPTNNHAERELRAFVLWRKRSFGTQSQRGNRFAERLMTIVHTARKQKKNVLAFLTACCQAHLDQRTAPSLFVADCVAA